MSFWKWLKTQKRRNGPIGDLARDLIADENRPRPLTPGNLRLHLANSNACEGAASAACSAALEYREASTKIGEPL